MHLLTTGLGSVGVLEHSFNRRLLFRFRNGSSDPDQLVENPRAEKGRRSEFARKEPRLSAATVDKKPRAGKCGAELV